MSTPTESLARLAKHWAGAEAPTQGQIQALIWSIAMEHAQKNSAALETFTDEVVRVANEHRRAMNREARELR